MRRVIVIGGGLAGQCAAIEAASCGANVLLLEKEAKLGGNSAKATSGINGWGTRPQAANNITDSGEAFEGDTFASGEGGHCEAQLIKTLSSKSAEAVHWLLAPPFNVPLDVLTQLGGHSRPRTHRAPDKPDGTPTPVGFTIMNTLGKHIQDVLSDRVTVIKNARALKLLTNGVEDELPSSKAVVGVRVSQQLEIWRPVQQQDDQRATSEGSALEKFVTSPQHASPRSPTPVELSDTVEVDLLADAVVLATGGFANDHSNEASLLREFAPELCTTPTTNGPWATGDGMKMARQIGATLVDMEKVQLHPTGFINPKNPSASSKFLGPEALRGSGGILVNKRGDRFVNELDLRNVVSDAIIRQENNMFPNSNGCRFAYCVLNSECIKLFGQGAINFYWRKMGLFCEASTVSDLASLIGCEESALKKTLEQYQESSTKKNQCPLTGKTVYPCVVGTEGPFLVAHVTPSIHYTMGGALIDANAQVQQQKDSAAASAAASSSASIAGLFAAGEVTGGIHGNNRLGGNSLLECVVFGRIAGANAASSLLTQ